MVQSKRTMEQPSSMGKRSNNKPSTSHTVQNTTNMDNNRTRNIRTTTSNEKQPNRKIHKLFNELDEEEKIGIVCTIIILFALGIVIGSNMTEKNMLEAIKKGELYTICKEQKNYDDGRQINNNNINISFHRLEARTASLYGAYIGSNPVGSIL